MVALTQHFRVVACLAVNFILNDLNSIQDLPMKTSSRGQRTSHLQFVSITIPEYVKKHAANNPGTNVAELTARLTEMLEMKNAGQLCHCGNPIWVIGSSQVGMSCFTCITGEATPDKDYEVVAQQ